MSDKALLDLALETNRCGVDKVLVVVVVVVVVVALVFAVVGREGDELLATVVESGPWDQLCSANNLFHRRLRQFAAYHVRKSPRCSAMQVCKYALASECLP